ncbi:MAG: DUF167 domain-containing protein [Methylocystaceae bacterium]
MINYQDQPDGCLLTVWVQPRSSRNQVVGEHREAVKIRLTAPPVEGEANQELCTFLARCLGLAKSSVSLHQGQTARHKIVYICGLTGREVLSRLGL